MSVKFSNNATTELASSIGTSDTSITVVDASKFPILTAGDYTYVTLDTDTASPTREIVKVTAISGNVLTVTRGMDGTSPASFAAGTKVELRLTAALLNDVAGANPSGEPIGFPDKSQTTITFDSGTRTFSITPTGASFDVYCKGVKYTYTAVQLVTIPNTTGLHFIYFSASGVLSTQMSYFTWEEHAPTAYVYWNATTQQAIYFADERHGITLDWQTHEYLHRTRGAAIANGFAASGYTTTGLGATDADAQIDIGGGTFFDEDMQVDIVSTNTPVAGTWQQDLSGPARIPVLYLSGSAWVIDAPTNFPFKVVSSVPQYNLYSGGTWSTASVTNNSYFVSWILATNNLTYPVISIISQAPTNQLSVAEAMTFEGLNLNGFPSVEFRPLYKVIYQYKDGFANSVKSSTIAVYDLRSISSAGVAAALVQDHGNLSGLTDDDHPQYVHTSEVRTPSAAVKNSFFPSQVGQTGKYLSTDGTNTVWEPAPSGSLSFTGDVTGTGSTGSSVAMTLAASGVVAGQYTKVTVDAKGRVTAGTSVTSSDVTTALGYTPYNATNPAGYTTNVGTVYSVSGTGTVSGLTLTGSVTSSGSLTLGGTLSLTSGQVTSALGYTPANSTSLANYLPLSGGTLSGQLLTSYSGARHYITDGTNNLVMGLWDGSNVRIEATGRPLYVVSYGGAVTIGRSSGSQLTIDSSSMSYGGNTVLHAGNYSSGYFKTINGSSIIGSGNISVSASVSWDAVGAGTRTGHGDIRFQPPASSYAGIQFLDSGGSAAGWMLIRGTSDTDVYTAEGITIVADKGWLSLAQRESAGKGVRLMSGVTSTERLKITAAGDIQFVNGNSFTYGGNAILHAGNYSSYALPLSGGTLTGSPTISGNGNGLYFTGGNNRIYFGGSYRAMEGNGNGTQLQIGEGYSATYLQSANNYATTSNHLILHAGNYSSYALPLSGGTVTGALTVNGTIAGGGRVLAYSATISMSGLDSNTYYPVTIPLPASRTTRLRIQNALNSNVPSWSTHGGGFSCYIEWITNGSGWGTIPVHRRINDWRESFSNVTIVGGITQLGNSSQEVIWLRGGGNYFFSADCDVVPTIRTGYYEIYGQSVNTSGSVINNPYDQAGGRMSYGTFHATSSMLVGSSTVLHAGNYGSYALPLGGGTLTGAIRAPQITAGGSTNTDANLGVQGTSHLTGQIYYGGTVGNVNSWSSTSTSVSGTHTFSGSRFIFDRYGYGSQPLIDMQSGSITLSQPTYATNGITVNDAAANGRGINLYSGSPTSPTYGLFFAQTGNFGTYGAVSADWATYFTMNSTAHRGWIFREHDSLGNVAAISNQGNMTIRSHFEQGNNIARPNVSWSASSTSTGMVIFYLPGTTSNYGMVHMVFDIYEYNSNAVSTVIVGGHNWSTSWYNVGANVIGQCGKEVRLGVKNGRFCVVFGTSGSVWEYGTIVLRKIHNGSFYDNIMNMVGDWESTQTTTESFTNITGDLRALRTPASFNAGGAITQAGNQVLHAGNYTNYFTYNTWDEWLRENGDNGQFKIYGNSRTLIFRTDGSDNPHGGGGYSSIWYHGGSADGNRRMILDTSGGLWTNSYGWLHDYFLPKSSGTLTGTTNFNGTMLFPSGGGGVTFGSNHYSMGKDVANGSWSHPHYADLIIGYHTGIRIGAAYSGIRFYNNSPTTDANNDGNGDQGEALLMTIGGHAAGSGVIVNNSLTAYGSASANDVYTTGGWFRNHTNNNGIYWSQTGWHLYPADSGSFYVRSGTSAGSLWFLNSSASSLGYVHAAADAAMGFLTTGGSWRFRVDNSGNARCYNNLYLDQNYGHGIVGAYSSVRYQGVFAMGDSYKLPADGTGPGNLYGLAWSYPSAGGVAGNLDSHGLLVLINGGLGSAISYSIVAAGNVTAYSDERLKTNWREMPENYVERLAQVKVGIYDRIDGEKITQVGIGAQSFQRLLPEAIIKATDEMGTLSVSYGNAAMASAVELAKELVMLKKELAEIKSRLH